MSGLQRSGPSAPDPAVEVQSWLLVVISDPLQSSNAPSSVTAGKQYLRYGCRRKVDSKMVHKSFCNKSNMKPRGDVRDCNQKSCPPPMCALTRCYSWCNPNGLTWLLGLIQTVCVLLPSTAGLQETGRTAVKPAERRDCRSEPSAACSLRRTTPRAPSTTSTATTTGQNPAEPATASPAPPSGGWGPGRRYTGRPQDLMSPLSIFPLERLTCLQCSVTCGNGTQQRKALCHTRDNTIGLCLDSKPDTIRVCRLDPCPSEWAPNVSGTSTTAVPRSPSRNRLVARLHFH